MLVFIFCAIGVIGGLTLWGRFLRTRAACAYTVLGLFWGITEHFWPLPPGYFIPAIIVLAINFIGLILLAKPDQEEGKT